MQRKSLVCATGFTCSFWLKINLWKDYGEFNDPPPCHIQGHGLMNKEGDN